VTRARRLLAAVCLATILALLVTGCGGQSETEQLIDWAKAVKQDSEGVRLPDGEEFRTDGLPFKAADLTAISVAGERAGRRAKAAGYTLTEDFELSPEERKHLTCFLTSKALDDELPQSPEQVAYEVIEYFGEEVADQIEVTKYVVASEDLLSAVAEVEAEGGVSADTALATVCDT
jgi:hypothetical protein